MSEALTADRVREINAELADFIALRSSRGWQRLLAAQRETANDLAEEILAQITEPPPQATAADNWAAVRFTAGQHAGLESLFVYVDERIASLERDLLLDREGRQAQTDDEQTGGE